MKLMTSYLLGKANCSVTKLHVPSPQMTFSVMEENRLLSAAMKQDWGVDIYVDNTHCLVAGVGWMGG